MRLEICLDCQKNQHPVKLKLNFLKKMGVAAFTFFLLKGLVWLAIFFGLLEVFN